MSRTKETNYKLLNRKLHIQLKDNLTTLGKVFGEQNTGAKNKKQKQKMPKKPGPIFWHLGQGTKEGMRCEPTDTHPLSHPSSHQPQGQRASPFTTVASFR